MKKIFKLFISLSLVVVTLVTFTACKNSITPTNVDIEKTQVDGKSTNGGTAIFHDGYLYYINGTNVNDGTSSRDVSLGGIYKVEYDIENEKVKDNANPERVVGDLVGFKNGSINIFGDYLYYATPCNDTNKDGNKLYNKTEFKRYDLTTGNTYLIYKTPYNSETEELTYTYYIANDELFLVLYELSTKTLKSIKIGDSCGEAYSIGNVESVVFSDSNGKRINKNVADANDFIYYTIAPTIAIDACEEGAKVYRVSPNKNNSKCINLVNGILEHNKVTILSIKNGQLIYVDESSIPGNKFIYAQTITEDSMLEFNIEDSIVSKAYNAEDDELLFYEADDEVCVVAYNSVSHQILYIEKDNSTNVTHTIVYFDEEKTINFVGVFSTDTVDYLVYIDSDSGKNSLCKVELKRNGEISTSQKIDTIIEDDKSLADIDGLIMPKFIKNNIFVMAKVDDEKALCYINLSKEVDEDNKLTKI